MSTEEMSEQASEQMPEGELPTEPQHENSLFKEGLIKNWIEEILGEVQNLFALSYVLLIVIGMINETFYYRMFRINIYEYSQVWDFFIAPFKRPESIFFFCFAVVLAFSGYFFDKFLERKVPKIHNKLNFGIVGTKWFGAYRFFSVMLVFTSMTIFYAHMVAEKRAEALWSSDEVSIEIFLDAEKTILGNKIGSNNNFIFLLDTAKEVQVIPINTKVERIFVRNVNLPAESIE